MYIGTYKSGQTITLPLMEVKYKRDHYQYPSQPMGGLSPERVGGLHFITDANGSPVRGYYVCLLTLAEMQGITGVYAFSICVPQLPTEGQLKGFCSIFFSIADGTGGRADTSYPEVSFSIDNTPEVSICIPTVSEIADAVNDILLDDFAALKRR